MYLPKHFEETRADVLHAFMRANPLATVIVNDSSGLSADHLPLSVKSRDSSGTLLVGHVARSNPLWQKAVAGVECLVIFHGRQHYISPNWYASKAETGKAVPTWNYEVVHVQGMMHAVDDPIWKRNMLSELIAQHESGQPKPWRMSDSPDEYINRMIQAVVGIQIEIVSMVGKFKINQNQPAANRKSVVEALKASGDASSMEMANAIQGQPGYES